MSDLEMDRARAQAQRRPRAVVVEDGGAAREGRPQGAGRRRHRAGAARASGCAASRCRRASRSAWRWSSTRGGSASTSGPTRSGRSGRSRAARGAGDRGLAARRRGGAPGRASRRSRPAASATAGSCARRAQVHGRGPAQRAVNTRMMADGFVPAHTICAPGDQAVDPHEVGHGPIRAHTPIVMDIFPRSEKHRLLRRPHPHGGARPGERRAQGGVRARPRGRAPRPPDDPRRARRAGRSTGRSWPCSSGRATRPG